MQYNNKTKKEWTTYLNSLTYQEVLGPLLTRMIGLSVEYKFVVATGDQYDRLSMANKPTREQFEEEFPKWLEFEKLRIKSIFNELAEEAEIKSIASSLIHPEFILQLLGLEVPNVKLYLKTLVKNKDINQLQLLASKQVEATAVYDKIEGKGKKKELGQKSLRACEAVRQLIAGWMITLEATDTELDALQVQFGDILTALISGRPKKAYTLVNALDLVPGDPLEQLKKDILEEFEQLGG